MEDLSNALALAIVPGLNEAINAAVVAAVNAAIPEAVTSAINAAIPEAVTAAIDASIPPAITSALNATIPGALNTAIPAAVNAAISEAITSAAKNYNRNAERKDTVGFTLRGIPKTVPGSGSAHASALLPPGLRFGIPIPQPQPQPTATPIDAVCPLIAGATRAQIFALTHLQILVLVEFYNETMGIVPEDGIAERRGKVFEWMRW
ncbi:hypothetical protein B0H11DRAFT_2005723 [Mycena galericulata]|nr:hypothetical protein B0H11DRAFT_2005723 [Mycena galericulata]